MTQPGVRAPRVQSPPHLPAAVEAIVYDLRDAYWGAKDAQDRYVDALAKYGEKRAEAFMSPRTKAVCEINRLQAALKASLLASKP